MAQAARYLGFLRQDIPSPITAGPEDALYFQIEVRSPRPEKIPPYITAAAADLAAFGWEDPGGGLSQRVERLYRWLSPRLLTCETTYWGNRLGRYGATRLAVYRFDPAAGDIWQYECLPVVSAELAGDSLESALRTGKSLPGFTPPPRMAGQPLVVVVGGEFRGPFPKLVAGTRGHGLRPEAGGPGRLPAVANGLTLIDDGSVWFAERRRFAALLDGLRSAPQPALAARPAPPPPPPAAPAKAMSEQAFLRRLQAECLTAGLWFAPEELYAFHTALKTGTLVVLAGLSGTGKSRLADAYRRALGLAEETNALWLAVRPSWDDDADLIGYYDPLGRLYRPGETGLVDLLCRAAQHPEQLFLVCFDEMNLARVEHYFAQFLSGLERPEEQRSLHLYAPELAQDVYNSAHYPPTLPLGDNLLFCGTVNVDESAHGFSDKVLDRVNLMRLQRVEIRQWWEQSCRSATALKEAASAGTAVAPVVGTALWRQWCPPLDPRPYGPVVELLAGLNDSLAGAGPEHRFGYRVVQQLLLYLHRVPRDEAGAPLVSAPDALDRQVAQRILTKVRGASEDLLTLFTPGGPLASLLQTSTLSHFRLSLAEVARKHRELDRHDFTS